MIDWSRYVREMNAALLDGDVEWFRSKMIEFGLPMSTPLVPEITMHKLRLDWKYCPAKPRTRKPHLASIQKLQ